MTWWPLGTVKGGDGSDGRGITSIEKTGTSGLVDTYTITYSDGSTDTFDVTNGADGTADIVTSWESTTSDSKVPSEKLTKNSIDAKADSVHTHTKSQITDFPSLATVATSGSYSDLSNKPTILSHTDVETDIEKYLNALIEALKTSTTIQALLDGTEEITNLTGTVTASDGIMTGTGYYWGQLTEYYIPNNKYWRVTFDIQTTSTKIGVLLLQENETTLDRNEIALTSYYGASVIYNGNRASNGNVPHYNTGSWVSIEIEKTATNEVSILVGEDSAYTIQSSYITSLGDLSFGIYSWSEETNTVNVRNLVLEYGDEL